MSASVPSDDFQDSSHLPLPPPGFQTTQASLAEKPCQKYVSGAEDPTSITYIQIDDLNQDQIFNINQNQHEQPTVAQQEQIQIQQDVHVPPWTCASPNYPSTMYQRFSQSGSSTLMSGQELLVGVRPAILRPRRMVPFPGTNGFPRYDDRSNVFVPPPSVPVHLRRARPCTNTSSVLSNNSQPSWPSNNNNKIYSYTVKLPTIPKKTEPSTNKPASVMETPFACRPVATFRRRSSSEQSDDAISWDGATCSRSPVGFGLKKQRIIYSDSQCLTLKAAFEANPYLSRGERVKLALSLDLSEDNVAVWFKNQRSKLKKHSQQGTFKMETADEVKKRQKIKD